MRAQALSRGVSWGGSRMRKAPARPATVTTALDHKHGQAGHHLHHGHGPAPVFHRGHVGDVGVEGRVVGRRAEEGHDAVDDDGQGHGQPDRPHRGRGREEGRDHALDEVASYHEG